MSIALMVVEAAEEVGATMASAKAEETVGIGSAKAEEEAAMESAKAGAAGAVFTELQEPCCPCSMCQDEWGCASK